MRIRTNRKRSENKDNPKEEYKPIQNYDINANFNKLSLTNKSKIDHQTIQPVHFDSFAKAARLMKSNGGIFKAHKKHFNILENKRKNASLQNSAAVLQLIENPKDEEKATNLVNQAQMVWFL